MRRCAGSAKFRIEAHEAPVEDFPKQASQKDGLGRMCRVYWNEYTTGLRNAALKRKTADEGVMATRGTTDVEAAELAASGGRRPGM